MRQQIILLIFILSFGGLIVHCFRFDVPEIFRQNPHHPSVKHIFGKNFSNIDDAIKDGIHFIELNYQTRHLPSLVFAMAHQGKLIFNQSWGWADLENQVKANLDTRYRICSISKTFTSALIGQLVQQGKLSYDSPIQQILDYYPTKYWADKPVNLTIGQLLSHTAGVHSTNVFNDLRTIVWNEDESKDLQDRIVKKFKDEPLLFVPGTNFVYSNVGFEMLGSVIESIMKKPFPDIIRNMMNKYGLHQTVVETPNLMQTNRARYYQRKNAHLPIDEEKVPTSIIDQMLIYEGYYAAGGILSTTNDLLRWGQLMLDSYHNRSNSILAQSIIKQMWSPHTHNLGPSAGTTVNKIFYGYGWFMSYFSPQKPWNINDYIWHSGGLLGTSTILMINPEKELVGVAMTNEGYVTGLDLMIVNMAENIAPFIH